MAPVSEVSLANGRRADIAAVAESGEIWIVEIKSSIEDFRGDQKWPEYRDYCDRLFFAVAPAFPNEILPLDTGLIIADRYGGEIVRAAPEHKLAGARRKAMTLRLVHTAAFRLQAAIDPEGRFEEPFNVDGFGGYFGARLARMRCRVRRCMLRRRAVSETLRLHSS